MESTDAHLEAMEKSQAQMTSDAKRLADAFERIEKLLGMFTEQILKQLQIKEEPGEVPDIQKFIDGMQKNKKKDGEK